MTISTININSLMMMIMNFERLSSSIFADILISHVDDTSCRPLFSRKTSLLHSPSCIARKCRINKSSRTKNTSIFCRGINLPQTKKHDDSVTYDTHA